ncbi:winged helix-turn-helix domain-containing protein [Xylella fastidiosa]|uniref:winged helix-turn-helix domain-containing protein n=1 Tax=Xylella fastidiosa TaxID=2371 RepID=UPI0004872572|nr:winged helix-turn-helix domain-containing protein [Xylella fastidiosa]KFA41377.1 hypothetical protein DF22_001956 [Xylella fastidiosa]MDC7971234.1 winged helix-turn-helix domain-containing protein [Xylella fastidiosa subsp. multiplex]MDD0909122.1 winged helix-turn-helix domain-containing protein [Xylella fastidiosa subsp. multiplex]MDD0926240.1 winged helix-turn-helix domain-containing protein [Xylella fastidiosa subsp. multiplex]MDD0928485.1 winged helix-turn-helix domain-containing protei
MGFLPSAKRVLSAAKRPLTAAEIVSRAIDMGLLETSGKTPANTLHALLMRYIRQDGRACEFEQVEGGFQLRKGS